MPSTRKVAWRSKSLFFRYRPTGTPTFTYCGLRCYRCTALKPDNTRCTRTTCRTGGGQPPLCWQHQRRDEHTKTVPVTLRFGDAEVPNQRGLFAHFSRKSGRHGFAAGEVVAEFKGRCVSRGECKRLFGDAIYRHGHPFAMHLPNGRMRISGCDRDAGSYANHASQAFPLKWRDSAGNWPTAEAPNAKLANDEMAAEHDVPAADIEVGDIVNLVRGSPVTVGGLRVTDVRGYYLVTRATRATLWIKEINPVNWAALRPGGRAWSSYSNAPADAHGRAPLDSKRFHVWAERQEAATRVSGAEDPERVPGVARRARRISRTNANLFMPSIRTQIIALRPIANGEQVILDYGDDYFRGPHTYEYMTGRKPPKDQRGTCLTPSVC